MELDRSDHEPFWRRGIPALVLAATATMRSPHYHRSSDYPGTLDYPRLEVLLDALTAALLEHAPASSEGDTQAGHQ
jgi:Zn-dependent M28 family amino/carboxypeptidase